MTNTEDFALLVVLKYNIHHNTNFILVNKYEAKPSLPEAYRKWKEGEKAANTMIPGHQPEMPDNAKPLL